MADNGRGWLFNLTFKQVSLFVLGAIALPIAFYPLVGAEILFKIVNPFLIAVGVGLLLAYFGAIRDAWAKRSASLTPGHILTIGISLNWIGITARQVGWYSYGSTHLDEMTILFWTMSMWLSLIGGVLHIGAAEAIGLRWRAWLPLWGLLVGILFLFIVLVSANEVTEGVINAPLLQPSLPK